MNEKLKRLQPEDRKQEILQAALDEACAVGYSNIKREDVARRAACAEGLVSRYFNTMPQLKRAVMRAAVKAEVLQVIAQGIAANDNQAMKAPAHLRSKALLAQL